MTQERFETGKMPQVIVSECQGDLVIRSWSDPAVLVSGRDYDATESETGLSITSRNKLKLVVPAATNLSVTSVHGDLVIKHVTGDASLSEINGDAVLAGMNNVKIKAINSDLSARNIDGALSAGNIQGDAVLRNVGDVKLDTVQGDLSIRNANGSVTLGQVQGDINLRTVNGNVVVEAGQRDAILRNLGGKVTLPAVQGDIRLYGGLSAGEHTFVAQGDIVVRWPDDAPLNLVATAPKIVNRLRMDKVVESDNTLTGRIDDGQTSVTLTAQGRIVLNPTRIIKEEWETYPAGDTDFDFTFDLEGLGERINAQVADHVARVTADLETKLGPEFTLKMEKLTEQIARKAERAAEKAERAAEKARRRAERKLRYTGRGQPQPSPRKKTSTEEQLKILRMVEKGVISPEEASTLLEALEN